MRTIGLLLATFGATQVWAASEVKSIDFKQENGVSRLLIQASEPITITQQDNPADRQVIFELSGVKLHPNASRQLDTSSFNSPVLLVSPYMVGGQPDTARIVVQLRDTATVTLNQTGGLAEVAFSQGTQGSQTADSSATGSMPSEASDPIAAFEEANKTKVFTGRPITLQLRDADVNDVLRLIGDVSGFNIVVSPEVRGNISLSLVEVPWEQALDVVLNTLRLGAERNGNVLRILPLATLTAEKQDQLKARQAAQASAERVTKIFPVNYSDLTSLQKIIQRFLSDSGTGAAPGSGDQIVESDTRTNSLVVKDVPESVEKVSKLLEYLDTPTPQVMVEGKVVEASESFSKQLGGSLGIGAPATTAGDYFASFSGGNALDAMLNGTPAVFSGTGTAAASTAAGGGTFGLSPTLAFLPSIQRLNAILNIGETESQVKIVSSPRTVVLHREKATILHTTPVIIVSSVNQNGTVTQEKTVVDANLSLNVTPTVTNDGSVLLDLVLTRDIPQTVGNDTAVAKRSMTTKVLVPSGETLVIGGIYTMDSSSTSGGFPWLRKIPLIGTFFGTERESSSRSELFFFITPRILDVKKPDIAG